jgi:excisionase family DNA binding protein
MGVSSDTVYRWVETHEMPVHRMGRLLKFKISEIDAWVKAGGASRKQPKDESK